MPQSTKDYKDDKVYKDFIDSVVDEFYRLATTDILIGHQFRKIALKESTPGHPLRPPLEVFAHHLPRIKDFWYIQVLGEAKDPNTPAFDLIQIHRELYIRMGELNRWLVLFYQVIDQLSDDRPELDELVVKWKEKVKLFENRFKKSLF